MSENPDGREGARLRRERRLAEALKANLKRRKAPPKLALGKDDPAIEKPEKDPS